MSLTQDLRWSLGRSIALQLQRQTDLLLCTINCFLQWDHLPNMAVGDLAFYYTLYLWLPDEFIQCVPEKANPPKIYWQIWCCIKMCFKVKQSSLHFVSDCHIIYLPLAKDRTDFLEVVFKIWLKSIGRCRTLLVIFL